MKPKRSSKRDEIFNTVEEVVERYFPNDIAKDRSRAGDLGKQIADGTIGGMKKAVATAQKKK